VAVATRPSPSSAVIIWCANVLSQRTGSRHSGFTINAPVRPSWCIQLQGALWGEFANCTCSVQLGDIFDFKLDTCRLGGELTKKRWPKLLTPSSWREIMCDTVRKEGRRNLRRANWEGQRRLHVPHWWSVVRCRVEDNLDFRTEPLLQTEHVVSRRGANDSTGKQQKRNK
jgi:hypothetical protein